MQWRRYDALIEAVAPVGAEPEAVWEIVKHVLFESSHNPEHFQGLLGVVAALVVVVGGIYLGVRFLREL